MKHLKNLQDRILRKNYIRPVACENCGVVEVAIIPKGMLVEKFYAKKKCQVCKCEMVYE